MLQQNKILILGIGNYLMGDEGVGVHAAALLQNENLPSDVDIADDGADGFNLQKYFKKYKTIILIDATSDNNPNGTITLIKPCYAQDFPKAMNNRDMVLKDLANTLQLMNRMPVIHLFVVSIESLQQQGTALTAEIKKVMPVLIKKVKTMLTELREQEVEKNILAWSV